MSTGDGMVTAGAGAGARAGAGAGVLTARDRVQIAAAWAGWGVLALVMIVMVARDPIGRSVTPVYRAASEAFWNRTPMYGDGYHGWLYLPNSALLYSPFTLGPVWLGEALFRLVATAMLAWAVWRVAVLASPRKAGDYFPLMTLLVVPVAAGAIRNGQMNVPLCASMALAVVALAGGRWWWAGAWMVFGVLTKPLGAVMMLLGGALRPRTAGAIAAGLVVIAALPLLKGDVGYAVDLYRQGFLKVMEAVKPPPGEFADLSSALWTMGVAVPERLMTVVRLVAALGTLGLAYAALRRRGESEGWIIVLGLAASYMLLMNPRTEGVSYPILMPALTATVCWALFRDRRVWLGVGLLALCAVMALAHVATPGGGGDLVLRPMGTLVYAGVLCWWVWKGGERGAGVTGGSSGA